MIKSYWKSLVLGLGIVALALTCGCQEERVVDPKSCPAKYRLLAVENRNLEKQIDSLNEQHKDELNKQEKSLAKCLQEKDSLAKLSAKKIEDAMDLFLKAANEENARLRKTNESLRSDIEALQKENDRLRGEIARLQGEI